MKEYSPWWRRAAWIAGAVAFGLTAAAVVPAAQEGVSGAAGVVAAMRLGYALLWWVSCFGLCAARRWSVHLGAGVGVLHLALSTLVGLNLDQIAQASGGIGVTASPVQVLLVWAMAAGSAALLGSLVVLSRSLKRPAVVVG